MVQYLFRDFNVTQDSSNLKPMGGISTDTVGFYSNKTMQPLVVELLCFKKKEKLHPFTQEILIYVVSRINYHHGVTIVYFVTEVENTLKLILTSTATHEFLKRPIVSPCLQSDGPVRRHVSQPASFNLKV